jgi:hypothetical protein
LPVATKANFKKIHSNEQQVNVYCRFRPPDDPSMANDFYKIQLDKRSIEITASEDDLKRLSGVKRYIFSHIFGESDDQETVFQFSIFQVLKQLFNKGKNGLVFSYGVTNSGKTFTMVGNDKNPGVIKNCFSFLFYMKDKIFRGKKGRVNQEVQKKLGENSPAINAKKFDEEELLDTEDKFNSRQSH